MWEDWEKKRRRKIICNIVLAVLAVVILLGLALVMRLVQERAGAQDAQLAEVYTQQQEQQAAARQEGVDTINAEYENDMQTVADYLPGIVCWGDSLTAGTTNNVSYPYVLQKYINAYICDIYTFSASIDNAQDYAYLKWDDYKVSIPVVNMGAGAEDTNTILGRAGVVPYVTAADMTIPAGTEAVEITLASQNGKSVAPLTGGSGGVNNVTISGIEGKLALRSETNFGYSSSKYYFTRLEAGSETAVPAGTVITTAATDMYKDYIHVVCIGTYGGYDGDAAELVKQTKELLSRQTQNSDRYIVLGLCSNGSWLYNTMRKLDAVDTAMMQEFGNRYINVRKYLCEEGMTDAGLTKSNQDQLDIVYGMVPQSFRSTADDGTLNSTAYQLLGKLIYDRMDSLGYFDEVTDELYIDETIRLLQKEDPSYLDNIANSLK